ncbi:glycosyltransferase family 4 protein [Pedobacter sp. SYP-B3415]|uniref:MraY family glycosyltransferase n=1 Tax=Pedobacter sp. SYP-B3415 TaxID=2496641 RepID=UPI00101CAD69|nr:glycosyltransferase family 4 protein [Pedobacter sp. SYP-B3415]
MTWTTSIIFLVIFFIVELLYFRLADRFNIIDKPNHRSSHTAVTIRGGGIIFVIAALTWCVWQETTYLYFATGLFLISLISFLDDILTLNNKIRLTVHLLSVALLFFEWQLFDLPWYFLLIGLIFVIGTINAYNFMDGINGITGGYSAIVLLSLWYINEQIVRFGSSPFIITILLSLLVFNFFNFRQKAKCFAGDVGSVSIAFIIVFLLGQVILKTENLSYILLLTVYGLDAVTTIVFRLIRKENIFEAHRSHFYQYLANKRKWPHLAVAGLYSLLQLLISWLVISNVNSLTYSLTMFFSTLFGFVLLRFLTEGRSQLLNNKMN